MNYRRGVDNQLGTPPHCKSIIGDPPINIAVTPRFHKSHSEHCLLSEKQKQVEKNAQQIRVFCTNGGPPCVAGCAGDSSMPLHGYVSNRHTKNVSFLGLCGIPTYHIKSGKISCLWYPRTRQTSQNYLMHCSVQTEDLNNLYCLFQSLYRPEVAQRVPGS